MNMGELAQEPEIVRGIAEIMPAGFKAERVLRIAVGLCKTSDKLAKEPMKTLACVAKCLEMGLEPSTTTGHAYIIPYGATPTVVIGYKGMVHLAYKSGYVATINANIAYHKEHEGGNFKVCAGTENTIIHNPLPPNMRGEAISYYAVASLKDGGNVIKNIWKEDMDVIEKNAKKSKTSGPWVDHPNEMRLKSCVRRLAKLLPQGAGMAAAVDLDERAERGAPQIMFPDSPLMPSADEQTAEHEANSGGV